MNTMRLLTTSVILSLVVVSCTDDLSINSDRVRGDGNISSEVRDIGEFDRVDLLGEGEVRFGTGTAGTIEIETDANLIELIDTSVRDGELVIRTKPRTDIDPSDGVVYRLGCPSLTAARLSGAGQLELVDCVTEGALELALPGAGSIDVPNLSVRSLDATISGAGSIEAAGTATSASIEVSGAGSFEGGNLRAERVVAKTSGVGSIEIWATDHLDATVTGVGGILYGGSPEVDATVTGVGTVQPSG